jgi:uncharacterized protein DUF6895
MMSPAGWFARRARAWLDLEVARGLSGPGIPEHFAVKRIGELALLGFALGANGRALLERAWRDLGEGGRIQPLLAGTPTSAIVYLPFRQAGLRSAALEAALCDPAWQAGLTGRPPFVRLVAGVMLNAMGAAPPWSTDQVIEDMGLFALPSAAPKDEALRAQLMAHVVFWHTGLGRDPGGLPRLYKLRFAAALEPWCTKLVGAGDYDSLAEVLGAAACLRLAGPAWAQRTLHEAQHPEGWVPARRGDGPEADRFHPTLVSLIAVELAAVLAEGAAVAAAAVHEQYCD